MAVMRREVLASSPTSRPAAARRSSSRPTSGHSPRCVASPMRPRRQRRADQHRRVFRASLLPPAPGLATVLIAAELGADRLVRSLSLVLSVAARSHSGQPRDPTGTSPVRVGVRLTRRWSGMDSNLEYVDTLHLGRSSLARPSYSLALTRRWVMTRVLRGWR